MEVIINSFGSRIFRRGQLFVVETEEGKKEIAALSVSIIMLTSKVSFSTDALELAMEHKIEIVFLNKYGEPFARIWSPQLGNNVKIRRNQLKYSESLLGLKFCREWLAEKNRKQAEHLEYLVRKREERKAKLLIYAERILTYAQKIRTFPLTDLEEDRKTLLAFEGNAAKLYFAALSEIIPPSFAFHGRSQHPAQDPFNCVLNYCYGILYSKVESACLLVGLDPYIGFLHTDGYNKKSLVFDLIEPFRYLANRAAFSLFSNKKMNKAYFVAVEKSGFLLTTEGKQEIFSALKRQMEKKVVWQEEKIEAEKTIELLCRSLAKQLIEG